MGSKFAAKYMLQSCLLLVASVTTNIINCTSLIYESKCHAVITKNKFKMAAARVIFLISVEFYFNYSTLTLGIPVC